MNNLTYIRRLQKLHLHIKGGNTGSPKVLANQFGISERSLYCLLDILRDMNAKIYYSRKRKTYYYKDDDFDIDIDIKIKMYEDFRDKYPDTFYSKFAFRRITALKEEKFLKAGNE